MDTVRTPPIRKWNPGLRQSDDEVREQFVVRQHEFAIVLEVLRENIGAPSCQHVLVVAPRGRGKTMLLARVAAELHANDSLAERLLPVRFMEESQEIFTPVDFWLETLFHLARESAGLNPEVAREVRETHADLIARWGEETLGERALAAVLWAADRLGKQLVLMVENVQVLYDTVDADFGWKLREVLQSEPRIMLLATATSRFQGLDDAREPFFELFRPVDLAPLSTEECRELWRVVSGDAVSAREMRPLEILTGGSPRLLVMVAGFGQPRPLLRLMEALVTLIDEHTEYVRGHMEVLPKTERRVYIAVIDLWRPSTTGEIAARARMDVRTVSTMLGRLADRGVVIWKGSGKKRHYVAAERLLSICYRLRREHGEAAVVHNLIRFMVAFYGEDELAETAQSPATREGNEREMTRLLELDRVTSGMRRPVAEGPRSGRAERSSSPPEIINGSAKQLLQALWTAFDEGEFRTVITMVDQAFAAQSANGSRFPEAWVAHALLLKARAYRELGDSHAAIAGFDAVIERFASSDIPGVQMQVAWAWSDKGATQREQGELAAAIATYDEILTRFGRSDAPRLQEEVAWALVNKGEGQIECGHAEEALHTCAALERRLDALTGMEKTVFEWRARCIRTQAFLMQKNARAAIGAFRSAYEVFVPDDTIMTSEILRLVPDVIALGGAAVDLVEILSSDPVKAETLFPLIVALREYDTGEAERAPEEVREVAADVIERIEQRIKAGALQAGSTVSSPSEERLKRPSADAPARPL